MRADPFDLSTWHCLDYRSRGTEDRPMTKDELAAAYVAARINLTSAHEGAQEAQMKREIRETAANRLNGELDVLIARKASPLACAAGALKLSEAAAQWRAAEKADQDAKDRLTAATKTAGEAFEALIAASSQADSHT